MFSILLTQCVVCLINAPCETNSSRKTENLLLQSMHTNTQAHTTTPSHAWYILERDVPAHHTQYRVTHCSMPAACGSTCMLVHAFTAYVWRSVCKQTASSILSMCREQHYYILVCDCSYSVLLLSLQMTYLPPMPQCHPLLSQPGHLEMGLTQMRWTTLA